MLDMAIEFLTQPLNHLDNYGGISGGKKLFLSEHSMLEGVKALCTKIPCFRRLPRTDETVDSPFLEINFKTDKMQRSTSDGCDEEDLANVTLLSRHSNH